MAAVTKQFTIQTKFVYVKQKQTIFRRTFANYFKKGVSTWAPLQFTLNAISHTVKGTVFFILNVMNLSKQKSYLQVRLYVDVSRAVGDEEPHCLELDERGRRADILLLHGDTAHGLYVALYGHSHVRGRWHGPSKLQQTNYHSISTQHTSDLISLIKKVQLLQENYPHRWRFQPLERIRGKQTKSSTCGMENWRVARLT